LNPFLHSEIDFEQKVVIRVNLYSLIPEKKSSRRIARQRHSKMQFKEQKIGFSCTCKGFREKGTKLKTVRQPLKICTLQIK